MSFSVTMTISGAAGGVEAVTGQNYGALQFKCMCNNANGNFCRRWLVGGYGQFFWHLREFNAS